MSENFDPVRIDLVTGETIVDGDVNTVQVVDPDGHPNRVLDPDEDFNINVEWHIGGTNGYQMATGAEAAGGVGWRVMAYGESMGPGPELEFGNEIVPVAAFDSQDADGKTSYKAEVLVPAGTLKEHLEGAPLGSTRSWSSCS